MVFVHLPQYFPDLLRSTKGRPRGLLQAHGETWRRTRQILSPTFSAVKMKMVIHILIWEFFTKVPLTVFLIFFIMAATSDGSSYEKQLWHIGWEARRVCRVGEKPGCFQVWVLNILEHIHCTHTCAHARTHVHTRTRTHTHTHTHHAGPMVLSPWRPF